MDEEFKVKFTVDMGDAEKKVKKFEDNLKSNERVKLKVDSNIGDINKEANQVFGALRKRISDVNKNPIWSQAKKSEFVNFFKEMESTAYKSLTQIEKKYSALSQELSIFGSQKDALKEAVSAKDVQAEDIRQQIQEEMAKGQGNVGTYQDIVKMQEEYNKWTSKLKGYQKGAEEALARGDTPDYESWLKDIEQIKAYQDSLMRDMQNFKIGEPTGERTDYEKVAKLQEQYDKVAKEAQELDDELSKMEKNPAIEKKRQELEAMGVQYKLIINDLQQNPIKFASESESLQPLNSQAENLNQNLDRTGQKLKYTNRLSESWGKTMDQIKHRMMFSFVSFINPINIARKAWSGFLQQNQKTANTFKMISQNLQKVLEPAMRQIANWMLKAAQYANIFTKAWFNVDLFDKSVLSSKKTKENMEAMNKLTAGFDELNMFTEKEETLDQSELPTIDPKIASKLTDWVNGDTGKAIGKALTWALEHPLETAGILLGAKFVGGLLGKGISGLIGKGISKLFGGSEAVEGATTGGSLLGGIFGKTLYTGMNGKAVTVGKLLGGIALTAGGTALAISQAGDAGKNWQDLDTKTKAVKVGMVGLGSAAAGVGAVMLGASGPVGWAVAGAVALGSFVYGMSQTQDGIDSVKKETEKLTEANQNAEIANQNYMTSVQNAAYTLSALEQVEQATGLSGAALAEQVRSGKLDVDNMTSAQLAVYSAYLQNEEAIKRLKEATEQKKEADKQAVLQSLKVEAANAIESKSYDQLRDKVVKAWQDGSISAEEAGDILSRTLANADDETQKTFGASIPKEMQDCFNPDKYESGWRKFGTNFKNAMGDLGKWFQDKWNGIRNWWNSLWGKNNTPEPSAPSGPNGESWQGASYAVGTKYVPNDQLAMVHKGEAIIPAKYNNPSTFGGGDNPALRETLNAMNSEIANLRTTIAQGIPVSGTFTQRGSDLVAVVDRTKSKNGSQPLSNAAFAR